MSQELARKTIWAAALAAVLIVLAVFVGLPFLASTQLVRDRIAQQLTAWSGYRVTIDEAPDIHVWPTFRAVLRDVRFQDWNGEREPILEAEDIEIDLSALAALQGNVVFTRLRLVRPVLRIHNAPLPPSSSPQRWGRLARSVQAARAALAESPKDPDLSALPSDTLGEIELVDGRILYQTGDSWVDFVTSLSGELDWPALNRPANLTAQGIWQGESVSVRANSAQPLLLVAGGTAPLALSVDAAPANASFRGTASLAGDGLIDGEISVSAPSVNRMVEWLLGLRFSGGRIGPFTLSGRIAGNGRRIKLGASTLGVYASSGRGTLELGLEQNRPTLIGTLAFDTLNLQSLVQTLNPLNRVRSDSTGPLPLRNVDFDLRFSAASATYGPISLSKVALSAKASEQLSTFDITDASGFGGTFQIGLRADTSGERPVLVLRLNGSGVALGELAEIFGRRHLVPQGKADFSVYLKGTGTSLRNLAATAQGEASATFGAGALQGVNLKDLLSDSGPSGFSALTADTEGSVSLDGASLKATVKDGVAEITAAEISAGDYRVTMQGLVPLAGRALALSATATDGRERANFFIGGSWEAPFITRPLHLQ